MRASLSVLAGNWLKCLIACMFSVACSPHGANDWGQQSSSQNACGNELPETTQHPVVFVHGFADAPSSFVSIADYFARTHGVQWQDYCAPCSDHALQVSSSVSNALNNACPEGNRLEEATCCGFTAPDQQALYFPQVPLLESTENRGLCLAAHQRAAADIFDPASDSSALPIHCMGHSQGGLDCTWLAHNKPQEVLSVTTFNTPFQGSFGTNAAAWLSLPEWYWPILESQIALKLIPYGDESARAVPDLSFSFDLGDHPEVYHQHFASYAYPTPAAFALYQLIATGDLVEDLSWTGMNWLQGDLLHKQLLSWLSSMVSVFRKQGFSDFMEQYREQVSVICDGQFVDGMDPLVNPDGAVVRQPFEYSWPIATDLPETMAFAVSDGIVPVGSQIRGRTVTTPLTEGIDLALGNSVFRGCFSADHWVTTLQRTVASKTPQDPVARDEVIPIAIRQLGTLECALAQAN